MGIAAGAIASRHIATLCGFPNAIGFDMGGTSTDISLVYAGCGGSSSTAPIVFPSIEVLTIGAGGGLVRLDRRGRVGTGERPRHQPEPFGPR